MPDAVELGLVDAINRTKDSQFTAEQFIADCSRWVSSEARNHLNPASHCDIAWAGALATHAHMDNRSEVWALLA